MKCELTLGNVRVYYWGTVNYSNLIFRARFLPVAALAGGIRMTYTISILLRILLCRPCPLDGLNANRKY